MPRLPHRQRSCLTGDGSTDCAEFSRLATQHERRHSSCSPPCSPTNTLAYVAHLLQLTRVMHHLYHHRYTGEAAGRGPAPRYVQCLWAARPPARASPAGRHALVQVSTTQMVNVADSVVGGSIYITPMTAGTKPWTTWSWPGTPCVASLRLAPRRSSCTTGPGCNATQRWVKNKKKRKKKSMSTISVHVAKIPGTAIFLPFSLCLHRVPRQLLTDDEDHPRLSPCSRTPLHFPPF